MLVHEIISIVIGYLLGSIPSAYIAARLVTGKDIRQMGGGNIGGLNTYREVGAIPALVVGIVDVGGKFERGDVVDVIDSSGNTIGCGICNYSISDIKSIKGIHSDRIASILGYTYGEEVIHRNNLVVLG